MELTKADKNCTQFIWLPMADTSYQGAAGRWVQVIKHKPHVGNNWSTAPITTAEKAKALFLATFNEVHQQVNY